MPSDGVDLPGLAESWQLSLRAANMSPGTVTTYNNGIKAYAKWCRQHEYVPDLSRKQVRTFLVEFMDGGGAPTTAGNYLTALKGFASWCVAEDELAEYELEGLKRPKVGKRYRPAITAEEFNGMIATCDLKTFLGKRDEALLRFLADSGGRSAEILGLELDDVRMAQGRALVRGKGDKDRWIPFTATTATSLDRYLRARRKHKLAESTRLVWLGDRGKTFGYSSMWYMVDKRARQAGVTHVHPHMFRRMFADAWLSAGGSTDGLMAVAGWEDMAMIKIYAGQRANVRGLEEHQRLFGR